MNALTHVQSTTVTVSKQPSTTSRLDSIFEDLERRTKMSGNTSVAFRAGQSPSKDEWTAAMATVDSIRASLAREAGSDEVRKAVRLLFGGLKAPGGQDVTAAAEAYTIALEDVKAAALELAVRNLLQKKAPEGYSKTFAPSAPELREYAIWLEKHWLARAQTVERIVNLPEEVVRPMSTAEEIAKLKAQFAPKPQEVPTAQPEQKGKSPAGRLGEWARGRRAARGEAQ